ncbi:MAG: beta-lactamase family protein [Flavobacteriaceae bacterium]|nr:beta-lactamase family protein [Flavobacteriaceae bacterium]
MITPMRFLFFCLLFCSILYSQSEAEFPKARLTELLASYVVADDPGLAVGVIKDGEVAFAYCAGLANLSHQIAVTPDTRFNIASTAKQFTALMVLDLALKGNLDLEDDMRKYLKELYPEIEADIKIRHLINHTSGIRDYIFLLEMQNKPFWKQLGFDNNDVLDLVRQQTELTSTPGSSYTYSNTGYVLLAKIIEQVTGESFYDYSKRFFETLGMESTAFIRRYMEVVPHLADPYSDWGRGAWEQFPTVTKTQGEGFLYTSLNDQLAFEKLLQRKTLENDSLFVMSQSPIPNSDWTAYGFGLELDDRLGRTAVHHSGSTVSYHSQTLRFPDERLSIFVMSNNGSLWSGTIADAIAKELLPQEPVEEQISYDPLWTDALEDSKPIAVLGQYVSQKGTLTRIEQEAGKTYLKQGANLKIELLAEAENRYQQGSNPKVKFRFFEDEMVLFRPDGSTSAFQRIQVPMATPADIDAFIGTYESTELDMGFELLATENNNLKIRFSNRSREREVTLLNRNELLASNFVLQVERDFFDRPAHIRVTLNTRAKNNRFKKSTGLDFPTQIDLKEGSIQVTTIGSRNGEATDILLTRNDEDGNEVWFKRFGGSGYDRASTLLQTEKGFLIVGSTSSAGNGNYDILLIETDSSGNTLWEATYGGFYNDYGYTAEITADGYVVKGTTQACSSNTEVLNRECTTQIWQVRVSKRGKEIANELIGTLPD